MRRTPQQYHGNRITNRAVGADLRVRPVRLSQCMIVKNEERNIERALAWAKGVAFEQIVVDTGSTDRTAEIAEGLGAKVFHFKWIDDFSAAKNFAIEKARGSWIAFLDADEYFSSDDAAKIIPILESIQRNKKLNAEKNVVECPLVNLNDDGGIAGSIFQRRIFRNVPDMRYVSKIHETLTHTEAMCYYAGSITIYHTGYTSESLKGHNKSERNVKMLERELESNPGDANIKGYLADSLWLDASGKEKALALYREALESEQPLNNVIRKTAHDKLILNAVYEKDYEEVLRLCRHAKTMVPDSPDYDYWEGLTLLAQGQHEEAWDRLTACERAIEGRIDTTLTADNLETLFLTLVQLASGRKDIGNIFKYTIQSLAINKYQQHLLAAAITLFRGALNFDDKQMIDYLLKLYDFKDPRDKLFLAKCAKEAKDDVLMIFFYKSITEADRAALDAWGNAVEPAY